MDVVSLGNVKPSALHICTSSIIPPSPQYPENTLMLTADYSETYCDTYELPASEVGVLNRALLGIELPVHTIAG